MEATTINAAIYGGVLDADLDKIIEAARERRKILDGRRTADLQVGDKVRLIRGNPKYLNGAVGTVGRVMYEYVMLNLDQPVVGPNGKRWYQGIRCPKSIIEKV
jgi:hypothetical protein